MQAFRNTRSDFHMEKTDKVSYVYVDLMSKADKHLH